MTAQLRMRYELDDYDAWRAMFDRDPLDRKGSGVISHRISRDADNDALILVDLDFGTLPEASAFRERLRVLLADPGTPAMAHAEFAVTETTETADY